MLRPPLAVAIRGRSHAHERDRTVRPGSPTPSSRASGVPTALAFTPDGRLLVTTQFGELRLVQNDVRSLPSRRSISARCLCTADERGLLGAAVDPAFASNGFVYLYYTRNKSGKCVNRVSRFTMSGNTIALASEAGAGG